MARVGRWIDGYTAKKGITLSAEQRQAVELAASSRMLILTGGPGTGKTFTTPTLDQGKAYSYELKAKVVREGQSQEETHTISVEPGKHVKVEFKTLNAIQTVKR